MYMAFPCRCLPIRNVHGTVVHRCYSFARSSISYWLRRFWVELQWIPDKKPSPWLIHPDAYSILFHFLADKVDRRWLIWRGFMSFKRKRYIFRESNSVRLFCPLLKKGYTLKGKNLHPNKEIDSFGSKLFPLKVDPFSEGAWCTE